MVVFLVLASCLPAWAQEPAAAPKPAAGENPPAAAPAEPAAEPAPAQPAEKPAASAEEPPAPAKKFYQQEAYDLITLDKANDNTVLKVLPLDLPDRQMPPEAKQVGKLKVRLFDQRTDEYETAWRHIEKIEFFEELVLKETNKIIADAVAASGAGNAAEASQRFDEAFEFLTFLLRYYPKTPGLPEAVQEYLYLNAGSLFRHNHVAEGFALLEELYTQNPQYRYRGAQSVLDALERVGDKFISGFVDAEDYRGARLLLERLQRTYGETLKIVGTWRERMVAIATQKRDEAAAHLAAKRMREAHDTSREMLKIWPAVTGGRELVLEIAQQYPLVVVGVSQPALEFDPQDLRNPAARRAGCLMYRSLVEYVERGPEGGKYATSWGTIRPSDDRRQLIFELRADTAGGFTGYDLSRQLLAAADAQSATYLPAWGALMTGVAVDSVHQVRVDLRRAAVLPQAWLQMKPDASAPGGTSYQVAAQAEAETRFEPVGAVDPTAGPKPVLIERYYAEPRKAIEDLRKGKIDMIDRLLPTDAQRLFDDPTLTVGTYAFPSLHVLLPNTSNPFLANRIFRRAVVYGINREVILAKGLLNGQTRDGCRVLSAPLSAGLTRDDPAAYAYDERIAALPYDPVMATVLWRLADQQLAAAANKKQQPVPEFKPLVLAHPAGEQARFVCKQIQTQLDTLGMKCSLRELPPGHVLVPDDKFDLLYAELAMREPLVDAGRLFGPGGIATAVDPYVGLTLRQVDRAENWKDARERLHELHRLLYEDLPVLPLWQMLDHFVYHRGLRGVRDRPIFFYQDVGQWRVVPPAPQE